MLSDPRPGSTAGFPTSGPRGRRPRARHRPVIKKRAIAQRARAIDFLSRPRRTRERARPVREADLLAREPTLARAGALPPSRRHRREGPGTGGPVPGP
nr:hypothetical protein GCM10020241_38460 [Streptoalloteichus tenebrarius]